MLLNPAAASSRTAALVLALAAGQAFARPADSVAPAGPIPGAPDSRPSFQAVTNMTSTDQDGVPGINGPDLAFGGTNWKHNARHIVDSWGRIRPQSPATNIQGALDVRLQLDNNDSGMHLHGPHAHCDNDPHPLTGRVTDPAVDIAFGKQKVLSVKNALVHPAADTHEHHDQYAIEGSVRANAGINNSVSGTVIVTSEHTATSRTSGCVAAGATMGSAGSGCIVQYDAPSGMLSFSPAPVNVLNTTGTTTAGIAAAYTSDPARVASIVMTPMQFLGVTPDGRYRFGPGQLSVVDPAGKFTFTATFSEYQVGDTSTVTPGHYSSYVLMQSVAINDVGDAIDGPSTFLRDFRAEHMDGKNTSGTWIGMPDTDFSFVTAANLAQATNGFTQSASIPTDLILTANRLPEPPAAVDLGVVDFSNQGPLVPGAPIGAGQVQWYSIMLPSPGASDPGTFLDLDTIGSTLSNNNDTMLGLFDIEGRLIVTDDDDGPGFTSQLSFGQQTPPRPPTGDGMPGNGRDGTLAPGFYYIAVGAYQMFFGANNFTVSPASTATGSIRLNVSTNIPPACYANCDGSTTPPILNVLDFSCFINKYAAGDTTANCDGSTTPPILNVLDFSCFVNKYAAGCT